MKFHTFKHNNYLSHRVLSSVLMAQALSANDEGKYSVYWHQHSQCNAHFKTLESAIAKYDSIDTTKWSKVLIESGSLKTWGGPDYGMKYTYVCAGQALADGFLSMKSDGLHHVVWCHKGKSAKSGSMWEFKTFKDEGDAMKQYDVIPKGNPAKIIVGNGKILNHRGADDNWTLAVKGAAFFDAKGVIKGGNLFVSLKEDESIVWDATNKTAEAVERKMIWTHGVSKSLSQKYGLDMTMGIKTSAEFGGDWLGGKVGAEVSSSMTESMSSTVESAQHDEVTVEDVVTIPARTRVVCKQEKVTVGMANGSSFAMPSTKLSWEQYPIDE